MKTTNLVPAVKLDFTMFNRFFVTCDIFYFSSVSKFSLGSSFLKNIVSSSSFNIHSLTSHFQRLALKCVTVH